MNDEISSVVSAEAPRMSFQADQLLPSALGTIGIKEKLSPSTSQNQKQTTWRKKVVISDEYSQYRE